MNRSSKISGYGCLILLFAISLFKDAITPDYLNTPNAFFLNPAYKDYHSALSSHIVFPFFWIKAYLYSICFIVLPYFTVKLLYSQATAKLIFFMLVGIMCIEYLLVYAGIPSFNIHLLPKVNRYFHSPFITLFIIAVLTLLSQNKNNGSA